MTPEERKLGLERIGRWPRQHVVDASDLTPSEQELLVLAAALLDIRPGQPSDLRSTIDLP